MGGPGSYFAVQLKHSRQRLLAMVKGLRKGPWRLWPYTRGGVPPPFEGGRSAVSHKESRLALFWLRRTEMLIGQGLQPVTVSGGYCPDYPCGSFYTIPWVYVSHTSYVLSRLCDSINITVRGDEGCPVDLLVAPCAVPSASLKEYGASREEGMYQVSPRVAKPSITGWH